MGQRLLRSGVVGFVSGAVVATALVGASAPAVSAAVPAASPVTADRALPAEAETVGPIATVPGSGTAFPSGPVEVAVMPDGGVSSGVRPFLAVPRLMGVSSEVPVRVVDASQPGSPVQWSGLLKDGWTRIETSLTPGGAYRVEGSDDGTKWQTLGWLVVRGAWNTGGSDVSVGAVSVSQVSGGVSWGWSSGGLPGPVGAGSISLGWSSGWSVPASLKSALPGGLPAGWRLAVGSGSPWASLLVSEQDGIARVVGWDGSVLVFARNSSDVWVQVTGGAPGFSNELNRVDSGTWEFVSAEGVITRFAGDKGVLRATKVFTGGKQISTVTWDAQQRVSSVTNEVGRVLTLTYAGSGSCSSDAWSGSGWTKVPSGLLCRLTYPDGSSTDLAYVSGVAGAAQLGLVKDPGNVATTLGWDSKGRLVAERGSFANRVAPVDAAAKAIVTSVSYDATGRATSLRLPSRATQKLTFPAVDEQSLRAWVVNRDKASVGNPVSVKSTLSAGAFELSKTSFLDPTSWVTLRSQDSTGAQVRMVADERGRVSKQIDSLGRVTTYSYNDLGLVTGTTGPSTDSKAPQTSQDFDTRGTAAKKDDLVGLRALVGAGANRVPEFWAAAPGKGGVSYSWSGRPGGWAGQATGVWDPSRADREAADAAGGWSFQVKSEGADVTLRVNGRVCEVDQSGVCELGDVGSGLEQVTIGVVRGQARGFFQVLAGPRGGKLVEIPSSAVTPGYGLVTESATNDTFPGRSQQPVTSSAFADPSLGQPSQVTSPGGLVSRYSYEPSGWERLTQVTTAGGATQKTTYWPDNGTATLPGACGGGAVQVSGQPKSVTRQDGTVVTSWPDLSGRVVASQVQGRNGATQTTCTAYFADGTVETSAVFDTDGLLVEESVTDPAVAGDYRVSRTTTSKGPGAGEVALNEVWSQSRSNLLGQVVEATGSSGVVTTSAYNALGLPTTSTTTAADGTSLVTAYTYRAKDAQVSSITVNGVEAATVTYDSLGRVSDVTYPGGVGVTYSYDGESRLSRQVVRAGEQSWSHRLERTSFGRILEAALVRGGVGDEQRAYTYDPGTGRLTKATITSGGATTTYGYSFGKQDASCPTTDYNPGADGLRSGGSRNGTAYVTCHDSVGRATSTTDPLVTGGAGSATLSYDDFGRVTSMSGADPVDISWGLGGSMTRLDQGGDDTAVIEMENVAGSTILRTVTTATGSQSVRYAGPFTLSTDATGAPGAVIAIQYGLPGGVQVSVEGGVATATIPDLDGSAMATITIPALAGKPDANGALVAADRFGPYGEPMSAPSGGSAVKDYAWRSGVGLETLPGSASITIMGARAYHPGLGEFLTPDPLLDGGDALYAYTSGDPINFRDPSGGSEDSSWGPLLAAIGGGIAAIVAGGAAIAAGRAATIGGAKAATWISGLAGAAAVGAGTYVAVKAGADSDTGLMIAGIAIATVGGISAATGIYRGVKNVSRKPTVTKSINQINDGPNPLEVQAAREMEDWQRLDFQRPLSEQAQEKLSSAYQQHVFDTMGEYTGQDFLVRFSPEELIEKARQVKADKGTRLAWAQDFYHQHVVVPQREFRKHQLLVDVDLNNLF